MPIMPYLTGQNPPNSSGSITRNKPNSPCQSKPISRPGNRQPIPAQTDSDQIISGETVLAYLPSVQQQITVGKPPGKPGLTSEPAPAQSKDRLHSQNLLPVPVETPWLPGSRRRAGACREIRRGKIQIQIQIQNRTGIRTGSRAGAGAGSPDQFPEKIPSRRACWAEGRLFSPSESLL